MGFIGGLNLYEYANADPINSVDRTGLCARQACGQQAVEVALSVALDFTGVKLWRAAGRLARLGGSLASHYRRAIRLSALGDEAAATASELAWRRIHGQMARESFAAAPLVPLTTVGGAREIADEAVNIPGGSGPMGVVLALGKVVPILGSGLELGELLNCLGFGN